MSIATIKDELAKLEAQITGIQSSALPGTVQKVASSATIAGTSTKFLNDLKIGQVISIPGTATEYFVVDDIASNTSLTVTAAAANNASTQTCTVYSVFADKPSEAVLDADCPAVINDYDPANFLSLGTVAHQLVQYRWQFNVKFLLNAIAQGTPVEWSDAIEPYPRRFIEKFLGSLTLSGAANDQDLISNFRLGVVEYRGAFYFGFELPWVVNEDIETTIAA